MGDFSFILEALKSNILRTTALIQYKQQQHLIHHVFPRFSCLAPPYPKSSCSAQQRKCANVGIMTCCPLLECDLNEKALLVQLLQLNGGQWKMASITEAFNSNVTWLACFSYSLMCVFQNGERKKWQGHAGILCVLSPSTPFLFKCLISKRFV